MSTAVVSGFAFGTVIFRIFETVRFVSSPPLLVVSISVRVRSDRPASELRDGKRLSRDSKTGVLKPPRRRSSIPTSILHPFHENNVSLLISSCRKLYL